jgi:hypothetical protein
MRESTVVWISPNWAAVLLKARRLLILWGTAFLTRPADRIVFGRIQIERLAGAGVQIVIRCPAVQPASAAREGPKGWTDMDDKTGNVIAARSAAHLPEDAVDRRVREIA